MIVVEDKEFTEEFQFLTGFLAEIEQKNNLIRCLKELKTDSTRLRFPKGFMFEF